MSPSKILHHLWSFPGGLKLDANKDISNQGIIGSAKIAKYLSISCARVQEIV